MIENIFNKNTIFFDKIIFTYYILIKQDKEIFYEQKQKFENFF